MRFKKTPAPCFFAKGYVANDEITSSLAPEGQAPHNDTKYASTSLRAIRRITRQSQSSLWDFSTSQKARKGGVDYAL